MKLHQILFSSILFLYFTTFSFSQKYQVTKDPTTGEKINTATFRDRFIYMEIKGSKQNFRSLKDIWVS